MKSYLYEPGNDASHKEIGRILRELPKDKKYIISIKRNKAIRSISANAFFHAVCQIYAIYTGHTLQEIKDEFKRDRFFEMTTDKLGRQFKRLKSTGDLDTAEFAAVCNNLIQWGHEQFPAVIVPRKEDLTYIQWINVENEYEKVFSGF